MRKYADECCDRNLLSELSNRVLQEHTPTLESYEQKVECLFYIGPKFVKQKGRSSFDSAAVINLLYNYDHNIDKKYYKKDEDSFRAFVDETFRKAIFPYSFQHELLYYIKDGRKNISLSKQRIVELQVHYFSEHVEENGLSEEAAFMFWYTQYKEFVPLPNDPHRGHEYVHFEAPAILAMREFFPQYDPLHLLKLTISYDMQDKNIYFLNNQIFEIFAEPGELRAQVANHQLISADVKKEYLAFFDACKVNEFKSWVDFDFKTSLKKIRKDDGD